MAAGLPTAIWDAVVGRGGTWNDQGVILFSYVASRTAGTLSSSRAPPDGEFETDAKREEAVVADIFISYAGEDRVTASRLADRFGDEGWTVF